MALVKNSPSTTSARSILLGDSLATLKSWWEVLIIVKPETVIKWHRQGFKLYWRWKSNAPVDRLKIDKKLLKNTDESSIDEAHARE